MNNNRCLVIFFVVLFVIYVKPRIKQPNTVDNYVMMNARRKVSKQLTLAARPSPIFN